MRANFKLIFFVLAFFEVFFGVGNFFCIDCTRTTTASSTTSTTQNCKIRGDYPPCGDVTLSEIVNAINKWANDQMTLTEIVNLINAWAYV